MPWKTSAFGKQHNKSQPSGLSQTKQDLPGPSWGERRVCGTQTDPKTWRQKQNVSFSNGHLPRHLEFCFIFPLGFPYPPKLFLMPETFQIHLHLFRRVKVETTNFVPGLIQRSKDGPQALAMTCTTILMPN